MRCVKKPPPTQYGPVPLYPLPLGNSPAVGQIEGDAPADVLPKAHVAHSAQADVEEGDDGHAHVQDQAELLRLLHLILQGQNLQHQQEHRNTISPTESHLKVESLNH